MKYFLKDTLILLIFFIIFLLKEPVYGLIIKSDKTLAISKNINIAKESYYETEYKNLANSFKLMNIDNYNYQYSKILYRDIYDFYNELTIYKGKEENIIENSAVINEKGLIGVIKKVNKHSSIVKLITNKSSNISVKINSSYGVLKYNGKLIVENINNYENINIGDIIYTSGIGKLPENIMVGKVQNIEQKKLGIEQIILVEPFVDFDAINYIAIMDAVHND